jgi:hypothetical protein
MRFASSDSYNLPHLDFHTGNSDLNFNQKIHDAHTTFELTNESNIMSSPSAVPSRVTRVTPHKVGGDKGNNAILDPQAYKKGARGEKIQLMKILVHVQKD